MSNWKSDALRWPVIILGLVCASCAAKAETAFGKLKSGDPTVCTDLEVQKLVAAAVKPTPLSGMLDSVGLNGEEEQRARRRLKAYDERLTRFDVTLENVTLSDLSKEESRASCNGNLRFAYGGETFSNALPIDFEVRENLSKPGTVSLLVQDLTGARKYVGIIAENAGV
jgi:hypothetical protein